MATKERRGGDKSNFRRCRSFSGRRPRSFMETAAQRLRDGSGQRWQDGRVDAGLSEQEKGVEEEGGLRRPKIRRRPLTAGKAELSST
jgi:hypothetical protein